MNTGTVKWFNDSKGYGFIKDDSGLEDVFVHHSCLEMDCFKTLTEGQRVIYQLLERPQGSQAMNVKAVK